MSIELPPLPSGPCIYHVEGHNYVDKETFLEWHEEHSARERLLLARVAKLEAEAKQARMMAWAIIRAAAGESWLTVPNHVVISISDECAIERHDGDGGYQFRAIDAARGAKP